MGFRAFSGVYGFWGLGFGVWGFRAEGVNAKQALLMPKAAFLEASPGDSKIGKTSAPKPKPYPPPPPQKKKKRTPETPKP